MAAGICLGNLRKSTKKVRKISVSDGYLT